MHTTVETVHQSDVENAIKLYYEVLAQLKPKRDFRYIK
jgi:endoglucanase